MISVIMKKTDIELNIRKIEQLDRYSRLINWGRKHPVHFIRDVMGIELIDYQKYVFLNTWVSNRAVWVCSRNAGKSFLGGLYILTRSLLFPSHTTYIMAPTSRQAKIAFIKMEDIIKRNIVSLKNSSDFMLYEIYRTNSNADGFIHDNSSYSCQFLNNAKVETLVGVPKNIVGMRSNLNFYDEAGKIVNEMFELTEPFTTQSADFASGAGFDARLAPQNITNQIIYASSAEEQGGYLWDQYVTCAKKMMMGIPGYFAVDINCEMPLKPTINGIAVPPLLSQQTIDDAVRQNPQKAMREYYNIFDTVGSLDAVVSRRSILRNEKKYLPLSHNPGNEKIGIFYDPALQASNAFVLIGQFYKDPEKGWKARILNGINLVKIVGKEKRDLRTPEQLAWIQELLVAYNGTYPDGSPCKEYENIDLYIDSGPGGAGANYGDLLMPNWVDKNGKEHIGVYDPNYDNEAYVDMKLGYPEAYPCLHLLEPTKFKSKIYSDLSEMMSQDLIEMPSPLPTNDDYEIVDENGELIKTAQLTFEERRALLEIDLMKEEIVAIEKVRTPSGNIVYKLPASKEKKMHDDRAYCLAMLAHHLAELRRQDMKKNTKPVNDFGVYVQNMIKNNNSKNQVQNPFASYKNPFQRGRN